jgi:hypothetical protein
MDCSDLGGLSLAICTLAVMLISAFSSPED